ncbi:hypothetical protein C6990_09700 [Nitrosopumilus sp. b3]|nr:hypothetical protein C6990_09700 [Nitrosopumilus sp. b3]
MLFDKTRIFMNHQKSTKNYQKSSKNNQTKSLNLHFHSATKVKPSFPLSILGYLDTWILGYLDTWILGYLDTWILGYLDTWILGYLHKIEEKIMIIIEGC